MYALNIDKETNRILSATDEEYAAKGEPIVEALPEGDISEYLYCDGEYIHSPEAKPVSAPEPSRLDAIEAKLAELNEALAKVLEGAK